MSSAFQVDGLLMKISKKIAVLLMKLPSLLMAEKIEPKILLIDKAVVTLLIRSFFNNGELFANCTYTISCYIIAVQEENRNIIYIFPMMNTDRLFSPLFA